jgi:Fuc2NAc and GlcNAc transferase
MGLWIALTILATFICSLALTLGMRRIALSRGLLDVPNTRSSHQIPTPRGGGAAIVVTSLVAWAGLMTIGWLPFDVFMALSGGLAVAVIGLLDDRFRLRARVRLTVHLAAAIWALAWLGGLPPLAISDTRVPLGWSGDVLGALGIVWVLNLFNFMDGIDGIAASEAVFIGCAGMVLAVFAGMGAGAWAASLVLAAACAGFLWWNWPPAKIFMGDVGSGYLGYVIAVLALAAARENSHALPAWLLLGGAFFVDATVTLIRRAARGERVSEAHRSHAYQWLARRWASHLRVTLVLLLIDFVWFLPWAFVALAYPRSALWCVVAAFVPAALAALWVGAGQKEKEKKSSP